MRIPLPAFLLLALAMTGCGGIQSPDKNTKENFSGTVQPLSQSDHHYSFSRQGELEITITSVTPTPPSGQLGLLVGSAVNGVCQPVLGTVAVVVNSARSFGLVNKGAACIAIFDNGAIRVATQYAGTISYP